MMFPKSMARDVGCQMCVQARKSGSEPTEFHVMCGAPIQLWRWTSVQKHIGIHVSTLCTCPSEREISCCYSMAAEELRVHEIEVFVQSKHIKATLGASFDFYYMYFIPRLPQGVHKLLILNLQLRCRLTALPTAKF